MSSIAPFEHQFAHDIYAERYKHPSDGDWTGTSVRVAFTPFDALEARSGVNAAAEACRVFDLFAARKAVPGGRYLYATGRDLHQVNNCVLLRCPDDREGWAMTSYQAEMALMTGAGIGAWYGDVRPGGYPIRKTGGFASGPAPKIQQVNETGRHIMSGGNRRGAIWAGLPWWHDDIFEFIGAKDWSEDIRALKAKDWNFPAPMDTTNLSVTLDDAFFAFYEGRVDDGFMHLAQDAPEWMRHEDGVLRDAFVDKDWVSWARRVYDTSVQHMLKHGEPGFTVDIGKNRGEVLRNACTEITSADDSDVCNIGSLVLPRFASPQEFGEGVRDMVAFLTAGSVYSDLPYEKVGEVREKNRRLGLGLIGVHEFCMLNGVRYGSDGCFELLDPYMKEFDKALEFAHEFQTKHGLSLSVAVKAIAPNGTTGVVVESTPSADPMFSAAERREVKVADHTGADTFESHIVVDPVAKRMRLRGVPEDMIEDAYTLSYDPQRRFAMTAYLQQHVDHAISGTVNLPAIITDRQEAKDFGTDLMKYLPRLRGITAYPDGARPGQPRTPVGLDYAIENEGMIFTDDATCGGGVCGV